MDQRPATEWRRMSIALDEPHGAEKPHGHCTAATTAATSEHMARSLCQEVRDTVLLTV
ncbi:MAG: hypothetical protein VKL01_09210 [Limnothrix sp.]|uniref:hypothetical protein n=1 Tax=unclassified Limnothrix TaxID=2632864 RepID=UPI0013045412|nr:MULTISPECIES: hypothetical protein [unclassified Limnothrix]MBD2553510.1 hypothetical protein [Limnothrix sp. FACHB-708]MBD2590549.1 hypothetical protein [Limnothrix sp. FACHB-406]MEB3118532.1 hypothetical protein [Limnothrix sp.]